MSDTFDHEGDAWDSLNDLEDQDGSWFGYPVQSLMPRAAPTCKRCGMRDLKWRWMDCGWRLYENERVEYNRLKEHNCSLAKDSDFDAFD